MHMSWQACQLHMSLRGTVSPAPQALSYACLPACMSLSACWSAGTHEAGHALAAKRTGVALGPPLFIPAGLGLLGSFGAITRIKSIVPDRTALAEVAAAGPVAGARSSSTWQSALEAILQLLCSTAAGFLLACKCQWEVYGGSRCAAPAGAAVSLAFFLVGLALTAGGVGGVEVDVQSFKDSLIAGLAGQVVFGDRLFEVRLRRAHGCSRQAAGK